jgi:ribose-phosphate pyrophosphokinase
MSKTVQILGFEDERQTVETFASVLKQTPVFALETHYRAGELTVRMPTITAKEVILVANIHEDPRYALRVLFAAKALRHTGVKTITLLAPWIAYGRQDRVARPGEVPGGLIIGDMLSRLFDKIVTLDAHSPMFAASFRRKLVNVWASPDIGLQKHLGPIDLIIAADQGAARRAKACASALKHPLVILEKHRDKDGVQTKIAVKDVRRIKEKRLLIVDDISDTGGTLITASAMLREHGAGHVSALVSHVPNLSVLRERVGGVLPVEALHDHATQVIQLCAVKALIQSL